MNKVIIKLGYQCNNNCLFCHAKRFDSADLSTEEVGKKIMKAWELGAGEVLVSGGEPTIRKDIFKIFEMIKSKGMSIGVISNGRMFCNDEFARKCYEIGVSEAFISLHSHKKEIHDKLSCDSGFEQTVSGIQNLTNLGVEVIVACVVNKQNYTELMSLVDFIFELGIGKIKFSNLVLNGAAIENKDLVLETNKKCAQACIEACEYAKDLRIKAGIEGFPLCLVPVEYSDNLFSNKINYMSEPHENEFFKTDIGPRIKTQRCDDCNESSECFGIGEEYYKIFGDSELQPF